MATGKIRKPISVEVTNATLSFDASGICRYPLRDGYWLIAASVNNGFGLSVSYSQGNWYYLVNSSYASVSDILCWLTWANINAPTQ